MNFRTIIVGRYTVAYLVWLLVATNFLHADSPEAIVRASSATDTESDRKAAQERMAADVRFLSADEMRGRGPGTGGLDRAADFIAHRWQELALDTQLFDGSPFQVFTIPGSVAASKPDRNRLRWTFDGNEAVDLKLDQDFRPLSLGSSGHFEGPLVFVGYGISAEEDSFRYDDYAGLDVRGKVVIAMRKEPRQSDPQSPFAGTQSSQHALFATKLATAIRQGAAGLIFVNDAISFEKTNIAKTQDAEALPATEDAGRSSNAKRSIPTLFVTRRIVDGWLDRVQPSLSLEQLERKIDSDLQPRSFELENSLIAGEVLLEKNSLQVKNVIASIAGRGSLSNETIVIGAHYDHVGMGGPGSLAPGTIEVHNGADDNASGTAALLEISKRFADNANENSQPSRRLAFIAFTAEERGLLGSRHYVAHPRFAIESTVTMINLDMVGRLTEEQLIIFGMGSSTAFDSTLELANRKVELRIRKQSEAMGPSDHLPFFEHRVPVLHLFTGLHSDYHRPSDDFEKINTEGMVSITDIVYRLGSELAKRPTRPDYIAVKGRANIRIQIERRKTKEHTDQTRETTP